MLKQYNRIVTRSQYLPNHHCLFSFLYILSKPEVSQLSFERVLLESAALRWQCSSFSLSLQSLSCYQTFSFSFVSSSETALLLELIQQNHPLPPDSPPIHLLLLLLSRCYPFFSYCLDPWSLERSKPIFAYRVAQWHYLTSQGKVPPSPLQTCLFLLRVNPRPRFSVLLRVLNSQVVRLYSTLREIPSSKDQLLQCPCLAQAQTRKSGSCEKWSLKWCLKLKNRNSHYFPPLYSSYFWYLLSPLLNYYLYYCFYLSTQAQQSQY